MPFLAEAYKRRSGESGTVFIDGEQIGEITAIEWGVEIEQVPVPIAGAFQDGTKAGGETRRGSFRIQDVHDRWSLLVWEFLTNRRNGLRGTGASEFPEFNIITKLADLGAPYDTRWSLLGCSIYSFEGGFSKEEQLLTRDIPFAWRSESPMDAFVYGPDGKPISKYQTKT